jgi:REP element-mobilizing transposase RayT
MCPWLAGTTASRCVHRAFLLGEGDQNREEWLENRLEELADIFAVAVGGFSVMDNHLHVLLRLDPDVAEAWSDEEVVETESHRIA